MDEPKTKGEFSTLTPDGRAIVDLDELFKSERVTTSLRVLDSKILGTPLAQATDSSLHIPDPK